MSFLPPLEPTFEAALRDVDAKGAEFRASAARRLASPPSGREDEARVGLRRLLEDARAEVRAAAYEALGAVGLEEDGVRLGRGVDDPSDRVRQAAVEALARLEGERARVVLEELLSHATPAVRFQAVRALAGLGPTAIPCILRAIVDADPEVRAQAAFALGGLGDEATGDSLLPLLADPDEGVALAAALALADLGDGRGAAILGKALDGRRGPERLEVALAAAKLRDPGLRPVLARVVEGFFTSAHVRAAAAAGLAALGDPRGEEALRRILGQWFSPARGLAVECIGELGIVGFAPDLDRLAARPRGVDDEVLREARTRLAERVPSIPVPRP